MAVNLSPVGGVAAQFFDNSGNVLTGGKIYTYLAGTTTPATTYTSASGITAWSNPIVLDASGRVSGSGEIWLTDGIQYKFVLKDSNDVLIATYDNITGINSNFVNFVSESEIQTATAGQTVFTLTAMEYQPGTNNLLVFVDGVNQYEGSGYSFVETNSTTVTFDSGLHVGALVKFTTATPINTTTLDAGAVAFTGFKGQEGSVQDLADDDGSDWIGFLPDGNDAVARSAQDKMRDAVSVMDFGAVGDGTTDDSAAINAAIEAADAIYFPTPSASYYIASSIIVPANKTLYGYNGVEILAEEGITAIYIQGSVSSISGLTVRFNSTLGNFSNTDSIGILVRDVDSYGTPVSSWVYLTQINIKDCNIHQAYLSIQMEAAFYCSVENVHTYNDFYGLTVNKDEYTVYGGVNMPLPMTTLSVRKTYFHGTQTNYAIPTGSIGVLLYAVQSVLIEDSVTEYVDQAMNFNAISGGTLINHYMENINVGFEIYGALSPFVVINPWIKKGSASLPYCFRSGAGNITFTGGIAEMDGGSDVFYSPNPSNDGTATFVTLPTLSNAELYTSQKLNGGLTKDAGINLPTSTSNPTLNPTTLKSYVADGTPLTSGVPYPITSVAPVSGAMIFVTGYSLTGDGQWIVIFGGTTATIVSTNNNTGGTVTFSVAAGILSITSTGTSAQVLQYAWATLTST